MIKSYSVHLQSDPSDSFMTIKAAQSMDINLDKKLSHKLNIKADVTSDFNIGLLVGNSGSGKTTLAKQIFGDSCFDFKIDYSKPIIDLFPPKMTYEERANILNSIGLSQVVCWIRPIATLSNGQKFRAEAALKIAFAEDNAVICIDEWTSVVDRTVAKIMSHAIQRAARKFEKKFVLLSCHSDVIEWLQPDWIIDCNDASYMNRRLDRQSRREQITFQIHQVDKKTWGNFSKYHYLSETLPGGGPYFFGLFHGDKQIGFQCFANYVPGKRQIWHFNRTVIHPDYVGLGLGIKMITACSKYMTEKYGYKIMGKFSNAPIQKSLQKSEHWKLKDYGYTSPKSKLSINKSMRQKVLWFSYEYIAKIDGGKNAQQKNKKRKT